MLLTFNIQGNNKGKKIAIGDGDKVLADNVVSFNSRAGNELSLNGNGIMEGGKLICILSGCSFRRKTQK